MLVVHARVLLCRTKFDVVPCMQMKIPHDLRHDGVRILEFGVSFSCVWGQHKQPYKCPMQPHLVHPKLPGVAIGNYPMATPASYIPVVNS